MLTSQDLKKIEKEASKIYINLEFEIIEEIAERIANVGYANTVVINDIKIAQEAGMLYKDVVNMVAKYNGASVSQIKKIFETAGAKSIKNDDVIYEQAGLNPKGLSSSMLQLLDATANKTNNNLSNLCMTTAKTSQVQFYNAINKAYLETSTGIKSYSQSILDAVKDMSNQGAYVEYPSGQHRSIETAVKTNVLTGVNQTSGRLQLIRAEEMDWDLMELSAHSGARPEHAEWQGKIVSRSGKQGYLSLDDIGYGTATGFQGVNCRHTWFPYYEGSTLTYTDNELEDLKNENVTYNGKQISKYDATQIQRKLERNIRQNKKDIAGLEGILTSNNKDDKLIEDTRNELLNTKMKLNQNRSILNDFVAQINNLKYSEPNYIIKAGNFVQNISNERKIIHKALEKLSNKLQETINNNAIFEITPSNMNSRFDRKTNTIYIRQGSNVYEVIHEIGHFVETDLSLLQSKKYNNLKDSLIKNSYIIKRDNYGEDNKQYYFIESPNLITEYQGFIISNSYNEAANVIKGTEKERMTETFSEPFAMYHTNKRKLNKKNKEYYKYVKEVLNEYK